MGDQLNNAIADLQGKHNFANLKEEYAYVNAVNQAIQALENGGGGTPPDEECYTKTETDVKFITKANGNTIVGGLEGDIALCATKEELGDATDSSNNLMVLDPSTGSQNPLDTALANIYTASASIPATLSAEQMKQIESNILAELLKKMAK